MPSDSMQDYPPISGHGCAITAIRCTAGPVTVQVIVAAVVLVLVAVWCYLPTIAGLVGAWIREPDYSHGFLVAPLAVLFLWARRDRFPAQRDSVSRVGLVADRAGTGDALGRRPLLPGGPGRLVDRRVAGRSRRRSGRMASVRVGTAFLGLLAPGGAVAVPRREGLEPAAATRRRETQLLRSCK